jgi:hypothetical protein
MSAEILQALKLATNGLLYMSETDSPFEIVHWTNRDAIRSSADLLSLIGKSSGLSVEEVGFEKFFHDLMQDHDWHDADGKKTVEKYRNLFTVLKENLTDLKVFKVGEVEIDIYIVGQTVAGDWAGVMTTAVET